MSDLSSLAIIQSPPQRTLPDQAQRINKAAEEFEALVLAQLLAPIFAGVEKSSLTSAGPGEDAFQTMLQENYAKAMAARGGIGIADQVKASLLALQAGADPQLSTLAGNTRN